MREVSILLDNGADQAACGRVSSLVKMLDAERRWSDGFVSVEEAASLTGRCPETIRRELRRGKLAGGRAGDRGHYHIRRGDLAPLVDERRNRVYDAVADAQDVAKRRREA
jgi:IS30 family transposase